MIATPTLHLVRGAPPPPGIVGDDDRVLYDLDGAWTDRAGLPIPDDQLVEAVLACARVIVW